jgi:hypothetical protein
MATQAEVHKCKSEYSEAWKIQMEILQISANRDLYWHTVALLNVAEIQVLMGAPKHDVEQNVDLATRSIYTAEAWVTSACYAVLGALQLGDKDLCAAQLLFENCLQLDYNAELKFLCLEGLGNVSQWGADYSMFQWTTMFLIYSMKCKQHLQIHKALQFCGDTFLREQDEGTAITLFTVALEGFTYMDVHRSRAECMVRLGDISNNHGDQLRAVELWSTARPLFERSSQLGEVKCVDERLACVGRDVLEQHKQNTACLVDLNVPSGNSCNIEDEEQVKLADEPHKQVVV